MFLPFSLDLHMTILWCNFYGAAKVQKLTQPRQNVDDLILRPIISNLVTATYETAKYSAGLLAPLSKSGNTILNTEGFIFLFLRQTKITLFIYLLIKRQGG